MMKNVALGIIDAQRGFMPAHEGERLNIQGFGELGVTHGERIVPKLNALLGAFALRDLPVFTTQDWHPIETAHFAADPNFNTTWPVHCVAGTAGAELHPEIELRADTMQFRKGDEVLLDGAEDTSYTGYNAYNEERNITAPELLKNRGVDTLVLGGLALDYCVKATALDFRQKMGLDVIVITDATAPVAQETGLTAIDELEAAGIRFATTEELLERLAATAA